MTRVVSYSLWGTRKRYVIGAVENALDCARIYNGWECWFYCDANVPASTITSLAELSNVRVIHIPGVDYLGLFWRFYPAADPSVELFVSRDCDSRVSQKERASVEEWIESGKMAHSIHDSRYHRHVFMGGMCGFRYGVMPDIHELIALFLKSNKPTYGSDQNFLAQIIFPRVSDSIVFHSSQECSRRWTGSIPFPVQSSVRGGFIGARVWS